VPRGVGTYASRGMVMAGSAVHAACGDLVELARAAAAVVLEVAPEELIYTRGAFRHAHQPGPSVTLADAAGSTRNKRLVGRGRHEAEQVTFGFGTHAAVCSVDSNTGLVRVEALVLGYDAGRVIDQAVVEGQLRGAATQAIGGTLLEWFAYDSTGTPLATTFMDYLMPTAAQAPRITIILASSEVRDNPLGVRGVGEAGIPGIAAAIARAIESACGSQATLYATPIRTDVTWALCPRPAGG
jgi:aerobic carbon-monoxide dehydrogenase large subunit